MQLLSNCVIFKQIIIKAWLWKKFARKSHIYTCLVNIVLKIFCLNNIYTISFQFFLEFNHIFFYYILVCFRNYIFSKFLLLREKEKNYKITCSYFPTKFVLNFCCWGALHTHSHICTNTSNHKYCTRPVSNMFHGCYKGQVWLTPNHIK